MRNRNYKGQPNNSTSETSTDQFRVSSPIGTASDQLNFERVEEEDFNDWMFDMAAAPESCYTTNTTVNKNLAAYTFKNLNMVRSWWDK
jgi:hypothetical protein